MKARARNGCRAAAQVRARKKRRGRSMFSAAMGRRRCARRCPYSRDAAPRQARSPDFPSRSKDGRQTKATFQVGQAVPRSLGRGHRTTPAFIRQCVDLLRRAVAGTDASGVERHVSSSHPIGRRRWRRCSRSTSRAAQRVEVDRDRSAARAPLGDRSRSRRAHE